MLSHISTPHNPSSPTTHWMRNISSSSFSNSLPLLSPPPPCVTPCRCINSLLIDGSILQVPITPFPFLPLFFFFFSFLFFSLLFCSLLWSSFLISYYFLFLISYFLFLISYFLFLVSYSLVSHFPFSPAKTNNPIVLESRKDVILCVLLVIGGTPFLVFLHLFLSPFFLPIPSNPLSDASSFPLLDPFCVFFAFMTSLNRLLLRCVLFSYFLFRIFFLFSLSLFSFSNSNLLGINISFFWSMREHLLLNKPSTCLSSALRLTSTNGPG